MDKQAGAFVRDLKDRLGATGFTSDADRLAPLLTDWRGRYTGRAIGCAFPASREDVAYVLRLCAEHGVPIVPQGGNTSMSGGATPDTSGTALLLSLRRMAALEIDTEANLAMCEAGVVLQSLHEAATAAGRRFPLTLGGRGSGTSMSVTPPATGST